MTLTPAVSKGLLDVLIRAGLVAILGLCLLTGSSFRS